MCNSLIHFPKVWTPSLICDNEIHYHNMKRSSKNILSWYNFTPTDPDRLWPGSISRLVWKMQDLEGSTQDEGG